MFYLEESSHPNFLPLVECTIVGLPYPFGKLLQGEFGLLQADCRFPFCTAQVQRIVALIICIIIVVGHLRQRGQFCNPSDICFPWFRWGLELFWREGNLGSPRGTRRRFRWRIRAGQCWLIDWMVFWPSWRHSRCTWRWRRLFWNLRRGEQLRPTITTRAGYILARVAHNLQDILGLCWRVVANCVSC